MTDSLDGSGTGSPGPSWNKDRENEFVVVDDEDAALAAAGPVLSWCLLRHLPQCSILHVADYLAFSRFVGLL